MKKEMLFILIVFLFMSSLASAKIICSDGSSVQWDQKEINKYARKEINGLRLALSEIIEYNVLQTTNVKLILEATLVTLTNEIPSQELEFSTGKYNVTLSNISSSAVKIGINGEFKNLIINEPETIKGTYIMLLNAQVENINAEMIIGSQQISLSTNEEPSKKINIANSTYIIELISASENAIIKVNKCKSGDILEEESQNKIQETNNITTIEANDTENINKTISGNETTPNITEQNETITQQDQQEKPGPIKKVINWFKKLFSWILD